ncbi:Rne/Rng family ribonuclease [Sneathiella sp. P13V-1]|uniref:Rne/Rng family ribonuclease n=1 Tax=Sneathiella sp. P13V-1 TaxID=2697366 RepID=UPI00187BC07D|nr:ribonuclease E/G [Sneathiella sp. P13V-1]MBE7637174.1 Rne/Rng family ribonuclease [Sneathiella sp. P13V-1]
MATRMLVDASHDEETRVVIVKGTRLEEFDYETASKKQLKGNIYLAKVTRVEPSLQAAFVEYGGNRHGFLPFSEIHPDYYQIPVSDREELIEQDSLAEKEALEAEDLNVDELTSSETETETEEIDAAASETSDDDEEGVVDDEGDTLGGLETIDSEDQDVVENLGGDDEAEPGHKTDIKRTYKIQEVIKRRQILLVQVVKEERGNKGAALTTYISLPGRYSVLMPNTGRGGGISRKISNPSDRKRLKKIASELEVPEGVGVIIRTAGLNRTKVEIRRDYEFLLRMWDDIRELTLKSMAPCCIYEEANLIKRSIRDLYSKDISEILVEGDGGYRTAKDFMRKLMPSHAKKVQPYRDRIPLFHRFQVEQQFASMYNPEVTLKSGGYIVINPTEALVSIDVNSGKATKERSIEETAVKTNLEAAEEIARQLRLRDLAGLIVIDFIDMDDNRNNKAVERRLKDCLKSDRARIQVGRISPFGLLEMSRQRLRPSFLETSTNICPTCGGSGFVRSTESTALLIIRALEEEGVRGRSAKITVTVHTDVAIYLLNQKRSVIQDLESTYGLTILILADPTLDQNDHQIDREKGTRQPVAEITEGTVPDAVQGGSLEGEEEELEKESSSAKRRRRRRRRKNRDDEDRDEIPVEATDSDEENTETSSENQDEEPRRRRRGKRGGRRRSRGSNTDSDQFETLGADTDVEPEIVVIPISGPEAETSIEAVALEAKDVTETEASADNESEEKKKPARRRGRRRKEENAVEEEAATEISEAAPAPQEASEEAEGVEKVRPRRRRRTRKPAEEAGEQTVEQKEVAEASADAPTDEAQEAVKPKRGRRKKVEKPETDGEEAEEQPKKRRGRKPKKEAVSEQPSEPKEVKAEKPVETPKVEAPKPTPVPEGPISSVETVVKDVSEAPRTSRRAGWWSRKKD